MYNQFIWSYGYKKILAENNLNFTKKTEMYAI